MRNSAPPSAWTGSRRRRTESPGFSLLAAALLAGCASTQQAKQVQTDSFLAPYKSLLVQDHSGKRAILHYDRPGTHWATYHSLELEPVLLLSDRKSELSAKQKQQLQKLVDDFYIALYKRLSKVYTMVDAPGPGVLQMQVAISHGEPSEVGLAFVSKIPSPLRLANTVWYKASGKPAFAGEITLEVVIKDAQSGNLLAAAADRQVGTMKLFTKDAFDSWGDVKDALRYYTQAIAFRLCKTRGASGCVKPSP